MTPYFSTPERLVDLRIAAKSWWGTPFVPNAAIKGHGVSCQKLAGLLLMEAGALPLNFELPSEPMNWSHANKDSLLEKFMDGHPDFFASVEGPAYLTARPGDVVGILYGGCVHHCGVVLHPNGDFIHCIRGHGTIISHLRDAAYMRTVRRIWRPLEISPTLTPKNYVRKQDTNPTAAVRPTGSADEQLATGGTGGLCSRDSQDSGNGHLACVQSPDGHSDEHHHNQEVTGWRKWLAGLVRFFQRRFKF